ncbi:MAG: thioredoxin family protein, partial [Methylobacteriaceae bacterium]|nr:thioredoxin family protein [Methylobacteriaceae bacterium]
LTLPVGAKASAISWPAPLRLAEGPVMTFSYIGEVLLPITVTPAQDAASLPIDAKASWLVCEKICIPEEGGFHLDVPLGTPSPSPQAPLFAAADARIPRPSPYRATLAPDGTLSLSGKGISARSVKDAWFFPSAWGPIDQAAPQKLTVADGAFSLALKPGQMFDPKASLTGVLVIQDADGRESAFDVTTPGEPSGVTARPPPPGTATANPPAGEAAAPSPNSSAGSAPALPRDMAGMAQTLLLAFLAGVILNLMPCVFPILAIKAVAIAKLSGSARSAVRAHALAYTAGALATFGGLGGLLLALRAFGIAAGWGFQLQSPTFVIAMAWLLFAVGLNLSGAFAVSGGFLAAGQSLAGRDGLIGSFFTGLLAVLVAAPCTAPFMGAAVAAALAAPAPLALAVFVAMGLGLAAPYALLALAPGLAGLLPKPGAWMETLKQLLAFPMYAAAAWLVWVASQQAGSDGVLAALAGMVLIGFAVWAFGATAGVRAGWRIGGRSMAAVAAVAAAVILYEIAASPAAPPAADALAGDAEPYTPARLAALRAEGRPVFVNMTAAWCVTCLVNERLALSSERVRKMFTDHHVAYLKGDWTRADPAITQFLREHDRDGVPLYVFYGAHGAAPVILPQILTEASVLDELDRLGS